MTVVPPPTQPVPPQDPYFVWAQDTDFADYGDVPEDSMVSILAECRSEGDLHQLNLDLKKWPGNQQGANAYIHKAYLESWRLTKKPLSRFCTLSVQKSLLQYLNLEQTILRWELGLPVVRSRFMPYEAIVESDSGSTASAAPVTAVKLKGVVAAVIDDRVETEHSEFQDAANRSRVRFVWDQEPEGLAVPTPAGFNYGIQTIVARKGKKTAAKAAPPPYVRSFVPRGNHGTAVAALMSGKTSPWFDLTRFDPARIPVQHSPRHDDASSAQIVVVQLPARAVVDTSGGALRPNVLDALRYVISVCDSSAKIVINVSYGGLAGAHDGSSILEKAMEDLVTKLNPNLFIVFPQGNSREAMCHANFDLKSRASSSLVWKVSPDCRTPSFLQVWFPKNTDLRGISISMNTPGGISGGVSVEAGELKKLLDRSGNLVGSVNFLSSSALGLDRAMALLALPPTATMASGRTPAPHGLWTANITSANHDVPDVHAWIERNDTAPGRRNFGRQSRFSDDDYTRFGIVPGDPKDSQKGYVRRSGTTNNVATTKYVEIAGGYQLSDATRAAYSSGGKRDSIRGPFVLAPSEESPTQHGLRVHGNSVGDTLRMRGTSVSAPIWARHALNLYSAGLIPPKTKDIASLAVPLPLPPLPIPLPPNLQVPPSPSNVVYIPPDPDLGFGCFDPRP